MAEGGPGRKERLLVAKGLSYRELTQNFRQGVLETARRSMQNFRAGTKMPKVGEVHGPVGLPRIDGQRSLDLQKGKGNVVDQYA